MSTSANIDFACHGCQRVLTVPSDSIGRKAKCPQCGVISTVPAEASQPEANSPVTPQVKPQSNPQSNPQFNPQPTPQFQSDEAASATAADLGMRFIDTPQTSNTQPPSQSVSPQSASASSAGTSVQPPSQPLAPAQETETKKLFDRICTEIGKVFVGQDEIVLGTMVALFSSGHVLIESNPGLGKTLFVRSMGRVLGCDFGRIQFTADLMPSDITGAPLFDMKTQEFRFRPGPVFTQLLLADEINRAPAKTHAALLEIMQEYRVTVDGVSHQIERPFLVLATQNPLESEGTYNLPEAQLDRFMFKLIADYPNEAEEARILDLHSRQVSIDSQLAELEQVCTTEDILRITSENSNVRIDPRLIDYINKLVRRTREWPQFHNGASPRAGIALMQGARTLAAFYGRDYAVPDDVQEIAKAALRHRVMLTAEAEVEGHLVDDLLAEMIRTVEVPRL